MRISTAQMFTQNTNNILNTQSAVNESTQKISSGKRVEVSGDDPVAALGIDNLKQKNALLSQYSKNIDYANNHLSSAESQLGSAENVVISMKDQILRTINGAISGNDRQIIADEMQSSLEQLLSIANSQDESGNYIFAGFSTDQKPFAMNGSGTMEYNGDAGARLTGIANGVSIATNIPGDQAFMNAPNPLGDYGVNYSSSQSGDFHVESAEVTNSATALADYSFSFSDNGAGGVQLDVFDASSNLITTVASFDAATPVSVSGIDVKIAGTPADGDSFSLSSKTEVHIFDSLSRAIEIIGDEDLFNSPAGASELAQILDDVGSGFNQIGAARSDTGNKLNQLDNYQSAHTNEKIVNSSALSMLEDLDYAEAITEFEKQQLALEAVSQVFSRVNSTSLFDYI